MSPRTLLGLTFLLTLPAVAQPTLPPPVPKVALPVQDKVDLSSPLLTIRSLAAALNRNDFAQAAQCAAGGKPEVVEKMATMTDQWKKMRGQVFLSEPRIRLQGDWASAALFMKMSTNGVAQVGGDQSLQAERVILRRIGGEWKVAGNPAMLEPEFAAPAENPPGMEPGSGFLTSLATLLASPEAMSRAKGNAQRSLCQSNLKQLALAAIMMEQDFDEVFAFDKAAQKFPAGDAANQALVAVLNQKWQKALYPYYKAPRILFCSLRIEKPENAEEQARRDKMTDDLGIPRSGEPYALNARLDGLKLADIAEAARTVLFYEGNNETLDFRHDGKSNVAFCDGHVKAMSLDEAKTLIWDPKGKNHD